MEDLFAWLAILLLMAVGGWVLGIIGFFSARRALREIAELRRQIAAAPAVAGEPIVEPPGVSVPQFVAQPAPEPVAATSEPEELYSAAEQPDAQPAGAPPQATRRPDIEALLTTRWGVWLGSAALLMSGVFLVRYAVDQGLLGPAIRCVLAALLGAALLVGAEWLRRQEAARQVLADRAAPGWRRAASPSCSARPTAPG